METIEHTFEPVYDADSKILILGTMPSPKSRETGFYYGHPQNRFWKVLAAVFDVPCPQTIEEKKAFCYTHHIALWDTLRSCRIEGASDASIQDPVGNDIGALVAKTKIEKVFVTGRKAEAFYEAYCGCDLPCVYLPSPSPANRQISFENLKKAYECVKD
ncbi:DNA-deoxyinosine glycosylase [uncultured Dubosiella sp.]|uniref:DNA-deoxyinosine glycosylase n=1 Tax=uncultured Dubosiella sp. TaxID=1937011 RepID=UPI0025923A2A|nr:DNA-deoxyinosine glycosylase [uncultured Dubosiella sp.]